MKIKMLFFALLLSIFFLASCEGNFLSNKTSEEASENNSAYSNENSEFSRESQEDSEESLISLPFIPMD